jgi:uncharacterized small protein (DUF1192 family)
MDDDERALTRGPDPYGAASRLASESLDRLSLAELDERIALLEAEIARVAAHKAKSAAHRAAADALFGGGKP